jgi:hypothetical protein
MSVASAMDKLVDQSVADARSQEQAATAEGRRRWEQAQGVYGDLGVAALDRSSGVMVRGVDAAWPYLKAAGTGFVLGGIIAVAVDAWAHRRSL